MNDYRSYEEYKRTLSTDSSFEDDSRELDDNSEVLSRDEIVAELERMDLPNGVRFAQMEGVNHQYDVLVIDPLLMDMHLMDSASCIMPICFFLVLESVAKFDFFKMVTTFLSYSGPIFFISFIIFIIIKGFAFDEKNYIVILPRSLVCFKTSVITNKELSPKKLDKNVNKSEFVFARNRDKTMTKNSDDRKVYRKRKSSHGGYKGRGSYEMKENIYKVLSLTNDKYQFDITKMDHHAAEPLNDVRALLDFVISGRKNSYIVRQTRSKEGA